MSPNKKLPLPEKSPDEVSAIKQAPWVASYGTFTKKPTTRAIFKSLLKLRIHLAAISRSANTSAGARPGRILCRMGLTAIIVSCMVGMDSLAAAPTLHEQMLASDSGLREVDKVHSDVYRMLRNSLNEDDKQQLKKAQINWINSLNRALAQTPAFQRRQVVLEWTVERTKNLQNIYDIRTGQKNGVSEDGNAVFYELIDSESNLREGPGTNHAIIRRSKEGEVGKALANSNRWMRLQFSDGSTGWVHEQNLRATKKLSIPRAVDAEVSVIPERLPSREQPANAYQLEIQRAATLSSEIATHWKTEGDDVVNLPASLPHALVDRLEQLVPWAGIDPKGVTHGLHANLRLAYAVQKSLIANPLNLAATADLLDQGRSLNLEEVPWVGSFTQIVAKRREKALALQEEALSLMKDGDAQAAESRLQQAMKEYPSASLSAYATALVSYNKLTQDKALRAVDGDWKKPSLPDKELVGDASEQATLLRTFEGKEVLPALSALTKGLEAAGLLGKFSRDYEPAGSMDQPHPIRALQIMRKSEKYAELQSNDSIFTKPFLDRMKFLNELIDPKAKEYEKLIDQGAGLEREGKYLDAASAFRLALGIEYSKELEKTIHGCEAKTSGL